MPENISLVGFLSRATPAGPVSIPSRCPLAHPYTSLLVTVNTQYLSGQRLRFLALEDGAKLIIETIRRYWGRLVILGLWCSNPLQIPLYCRSAMHIHKNTLHKNTLFAPKNGCCKAGDLFFFIYLWHYLSMFGVISDPPRFLLEESLR